MRKFIHALLCAAAIYCSTKAAQALAAPASIQFRTEQAGLVSINIYGSDGTLVRPLLSNEPLPAGDHVIPWDGDAAPAPTGSGQLVPPGEYTWRGLFHEGIGLKLRGWAANGSGAPWRTADGKDGWGGDAGAPSAVAADDRQVYLGWSLADRGKSVLACDLDGRVQWAHRRSEGPSGCHALAVDDGVVFVLGGLAGVDAEGGAIYRLNAKDGTPIPWPNGSLDLRIFSLWPPGGGTKPDRADAMAVRHGYIYLSFTSSQFLTVLDAKSGAYIQTVVGAPPGMIDVAPTQTELPDSPGKSSDADFAVISLGGGVLGRILFAHDPFWVITSDLAPLNRDVNITALSVIGDGAKFHHHTAYVGFGAPFHQVQARPLLDMDTTTWTAGRAGGRPLFGPWQANALHSIRGVALAADGRLWVVEGDAYPKRVSVWDTNGNEGSVVREFFGPAESGAPGGAINPLDPDLLFAQGCEWRIDRQTGLAACLGVVTREPVAVARYGIGENGHAYLVVGNSETPMKIFERLGDGEYKLRSRAFYVDEHGAEVRKADAGFPSRMTYWADENGDGVVQPNELHPGFFGRDSTAHEPIVATQDLTLQLTLSGGRPLSTICSVTGWTPCGAPLYGRPEGEGDGEVWRVSPDRQRVLRLLPGEFVCTDEHGRTTLWRRSLQDFKRPSDPSVGNSEWPLLLGSAALPKPLGRVWLASQNTGPWHLINEDGFDLAPFFGGDPAKALPAEHIAPGLDMTHAVATREGSITQAVDGKLYVQAGDSAYWDLEISGLEKVKALPGGKIRVLAP